MAGLSSKLFLLAAGSWMGALCRRIPKLKINFGVGRREVPSGAAHFSPVVNFQVSVHCLPPLNWAETVTV
jgi:hypothetical protein